jgi:ankyrin repeat protein
VSRAEAKAGAVWAAAAGLLRRCFAASPAQRPSAGECEEQLQQCYAQLPGSQKRYGASRATAVTGFNLFTRFPARVRAARFHAMVTNDHAAAAALLREQLAGELMKVPKQKNAAAKKALQQVKQALQAGMPVERALADAAAFVPSASLGGGSLLLPVLVGLVDAICRGGSGDDNDESGVTGSGGREGEAVRCAGALAAQAQLAWQRATDKKCCSYRLGSSGDEYSPLYRWCREGHEAVVRLLLSHAGIDANAVVRLLLSHAGADANRAKAGDGYTPLSTACEKGHEAVVRLLLGHAGIDANRARPSDGATPLFAACAKGHEAVVRLLLGHAGVDANRAKAGDGCTPLLMACQLGHEAVVRLLLGHAGIDANAVVRRDGVTPLLLACENGHEAVVRRLLGHAGIEANRVRPRDGATPLYMACQEGHEVVVRLLLGAGARTDLVATMDGHTFTCVHVAHSHGQAGVVALLKGGAAAILKVGARVEVHGLESATGQLLNGQLGVLQSFDAKKGRWAVAMDADSAGAPAIPKLLKQGNLLPA